MKRYTARLLFLFCSLGFLYPLSPLCFEWSITEPSIPSVPQESTLGASVQGAKTALHDMEQQLTRDAARVRAAEQEKLTQDFSEAIGLGRNAESGVLELQPLALATQRRLQQLIALSVRVRGFRRTHEEAIRDIVNRGNEFFGTAGRTVVPERAPLHQNPISTLESLEN